MRCNKCRKRPRHKKVFMQRETEDIVDRTRRTFKRKIERAFRRAFGERYEEIEREVVTVKEQGLFICPECGHRRYSDGRNVE